MLEFESGTDSNLKMPAILQSDNGSRTTVTSPAANVVTAPNTVIPATADSRHSDPAVTTSTSLALQGPSQATVGSVFAVRLMIDPGEPVASVPLALSFDPKALEVVAVKEGDFLKQGGAATNFSQRIDQGSGQVFATVTQTGKNGANAPGQVLELSLRARQPSASAQVSVGTIAPIGLGGRTISPILPTPLTLSIVQ